MQDHTATFRFTCAHITVTRRSTTSWRYPRIKCNDPGPLPSWDFNPILPHGFKRPHMELRPGSHTYISKIRTNYFRYGTYAPLPTQSFKIFPSPLSLGGCSSDPTPFYRGATTHNIMSRLWAPCRRVLGPASMGLERKAMGNSKGLGMQWCIGPTSETCLP